MVAQGRFLCDELWLPECRPIHLASSTSLATHQSASEGACMRNYVPQSCRRSMIVPASFKDPKVRMSGCSPFLLCPTYPTPLVNLETFLGEESNARRPTSTRSPWEPGAALGHLGASWGILGASWGILEGKRLGSRPVGVLGST